MTEQSRPLNESGQESPDTLLYHSSAKDLANMGEWAARYAVSGWQVFPLHTPQGAGCSCGASGCKVGKHPRINAWQQAFCDITAVDGWWAQWPNANIGLRLDDLVCLDVDGEKGLRSLAALELEHGPLDRRAYQRSGSGGLHILFDGVPGVKMNRGFLPGLDFLCGNVCYVVAEPSLHKSGNQYQWLGDVSPLFARRDQIPLVAPPAWLLRAAANDKPKTAPRTKRPAGERVPVERMLSMALEKVKADEARNNTGLWFFQQLRDNGYDRNECTLELRDWVNRANEAAPSSHPYTLEEAKATLRSVFSEPARDPWPEDDDDKPSHADILLKLTEDFEYFKSGPANDPYVRMVIGDHHEVWKVDAKSPKVREILTHRFLTQKDRAPSREALNTVIDTVMAKCGAGPKVDVHVRFARSRDRIFLDMCDDQWRAIEVTKDGWRVVDNPPVLFRRGAGARPLPVPVKGGTLESLRPLMNAGDDAQWTLMMSWLVGTFLPSGAFAHLVLEGERGSAKSTTALVLLSMLDPSDAGLSGPPKDEVDATVSAMHAGILAYDNLSGCRAEIADVFCRFSTGQGYRTRTFYENLGITIASVKLPILLNGIDSTVMRGDLLERAIMLKLPVITSSTRLTEQGIWTDFSILHPTCLGAILTVVSTGLRNLPNTTLTDTPRMSDFCTWVVACEPALPWKPGDFLTAYKGKLESANSDLAEADSVGPALIEWVEQNTSPGCGVRIIAKDLLIELNEATSGWPKDLRYWPLSPEALAHRLVILAPVLRAQGIEIRKLKRTQKARLWEIWRNEPQGLLIPRFITDYVKKAA